MASRSMRRYVNFIRYSGPVFKIFHRHPEHSETFAILFAEVFVMGFMRSSYGFELVVVCISENFKTLMDEYIVYEEVGKAVKSDAQSGVKQKIIII